MMRDQILTTAAFTLTSSRKIQRHGNGETAIPKAVLPPSERFRGIFGWFGAKLRSLRWGDGSDPKRFIAAAFIFHDS